MVLDRLAWALAQVQTTCSLQSSMPGDLFWILLRHCSSCICFQRLLYYNYVETMLTASATIYGDLYAPSRVLYCVHISTACLQSFRARTTLQPSQARNTWKKVVSLSCWASRAHFHAPRSSWSCSDYMCEHACFVSSGPTTLPSSSRRRWRSAHSYVCVVNPRVEWAITRNGGSHGCLSHTSNGSSHMAYWSCWVWYWSRFQSHFF